MTRPSVDHLRTQPLSPASPAPAPHCAISAVIPAQRGLESSPTEAFAPVALPQAPTEALAPVPVPVPQALTEAFAPIAPPQAPTEAFAPISVAAPPARGNGWFMGAAILTVCALASGVWGTVAISQPGEQPVAAAATPVSGTTGTPVMAGPPARQVVAGSSPRALAPGQLDGEGVFRMGSDLQPGTYRTAGPSPAAFDNCYWERSRDTSGQQKSVIASGTVTGPFTVTIKPTDRAFKSSGCETWSKVR